LPAAIKKTINWATVGNVDVSIRMKPFTIMLKQIKWARLSLVILLFAIIAATLFLGGCKKDNDPTTPTGIDDNSLTVVFTATANSKTFHVGDSFSLANEGFNYKFDLLKFYVSQFRLLKSDSTEFLVKDVDMIDFRKDGPHLSFSAKIPAGEFVKIKFGLGVDSVTNAKDPLSFDVTSPLASTKGTYWDMGSQYRFMLIEGQLDTAMAGDYSVPFVVHTGTNALYREKTFDQSLSFTKADNRTITIELNVDALISNADFKTDHVSHTLASGFPLAEKIANNLANNLTLK
jgi:hypothetical protein